MWRINYAPINRWAEDVGTRTTFDLINQQHTKRFVVGSPAGDPAAEEGGGRLSVCSFDDCLIIEYPVHNGFKSIHNATQLPRLNSSDFFKPFTTRKKCVTV